MGEREESIDEKPQLPTLTNNCGKRRTLLVAMTVYRNIQGVSKKMLVSGKMAITPLWKELGEEVIPFSKTTGSELSDEHKNFMIPSKND